MKARVLWSLGWLLCTHPVDAQSDDQHAHSDDAYGSSELAADSSVSSEEPSEASSGPSVEALSEVELDALGLESAGPGIDTAFHFWGFADFNSAMLIRPQGGLALAQGHYQNFFIGNLNLYFSKNLSKSFRTMVEVRLTYLPNGSYSTNSNGFQQVDTSTVDYANGQSLTRWGGIILQRVYLEWSLHRFITVRGGQFLTPFGIWNVDHGSFAYIPAQRPVAVLSGLFPQVQTGIEVLGRWSGSNDHALGYHLTLSNGTGPISEYKDLDRNKAVGGRVYWEYFGQTYVRAGVSGYYGRDTNATPTATLAGSMIDLGTKLSAQSDVLALAADVLIKRGGLLLQSEWVTQQRRFTQSGRVVHSIFAGPVATAAAADTFSWAGYALAAYRFSGWFGFMPFVTFQAARMGQNNQSLPDTRFKLIGVTGGLNVSPIDSVVFKLEFQHLRFAEATPVLKNNSNAVLLQAAWAF